jgi:hypothetical protein
MVGRSAIGLLRQMPGGGRETAMRPRRRVAVYGGRQLDRCRVRVTRVGWLRDDGEVFVGRDAVTRVDDPSMGAQADGRKGRLNRRHIPW